jgi:copper(I)-binding protein
MRTLALVLAVAGLSTSVWAAGTADTITVVDPYVRQVPPGAMATAAYMVLKNTGSQDAKLIKAETSASKVAELHTHLNEDGVMKMRKVPSIEIKAKGEAVLEPSGLHVMMIDLNGTMKEGDKIAITLGFDDGSSKKIEAPVRRPAPMSAMDHSKMH